MRIYLLLQRLESCLLYPQLFNIVVINQVLNPDRHIVQLYMGLAQLVGPAGIVKSYIQWRQLSPAVYLHLAVKRVKMPGNLAHHLPRNRQRGSQNQEHPRDKDDIRPNCHKVGLIV